MAGGATFNLADNAVYTFAIGASGAVNGATAAGIGGPGSATLNGDFVFDLTNAGTDPNDSWTIVNALKRRRAGTVRPRNLAMLRP